MQQENSRTVVNADPILRQQLRETRELPGRSNAKLAKSIGCNRAYIQLYIDDKFPGDLAAFERKLRDFFANEARRIASGVETVSSEVTKELATAFELIRKTNDLGAVVALSGKGKTRGIEKYIEENPTSIVYRTTSWTADKNSVESALFEAIGETGWSGYTKRSTFMVDKLRNSNRLIIADDAHKLSRPALQWFYDFHDATQCPIVFVGTLELLPKLEDDTQRFSRTGFYTEIKGEETDRGLLKHMVKELIPNVNGDAEVVLDLCEQVAEKQGLYRSVHKQLKLAVEIKSGSPKLTWDQAFRAAHTKLIRNFQLT